MKILHWLWILALTLSAAAPVSAQGWPTRPIQVIVPFPPGSVDSKARIVTEKVGKILGQPLVMVNKPGAGMLIGTEQMVRSAPDGYTIGLALQASTWISPLLDPASANYSANDMTMLGVAYDATTVLVAGPKTDIHSVQDLLRVARAQPGKLNYAAPTGGTIFRIASGGQKSAPGIEVTFVEDQDDPAAWQRAVRPNTKLFFAESIANPRSNVLDIQAVADVAHENGLPLIIDNTVASPYLVRPLEHGADIVLHSATKFLGGHGEPPHRKRHRLFDADRDLIGRNRRSCKQSA